MKKIFTLLSVCAVLGMSAQQDPQFSQFMFDRLSINPGYAGIKNELCFTGFYRQQWTGFDGAPVTTMINGHMPISSINSGVGLTFYSDELGQQQNTLFRGHYSYHFKNVGTGKLGLGASIGYLSSSLGNEWIALDDIANDATISAETTSAGTIDFSLGAYYHADKFYIGLSSTHLSEGELKDMSISTARHYYVMAGYTYALSSSVDLIPNVLVKSDASSTQFDVNLLGMYKNMLWAGVSYRAEDAIAPMIGYRHQMPDGRSAIRIGYSYDVTTSSLNNYSTGSHEVMLNYCMKLRKPLSPQIYKNVRFL